MESGHDGHNGAFTVNISLIVLLGVCTKLVVDKNNIIEGCGGGDCARACKRGVSYDNALLALDVNEAAEHDNDATFDDVKLDDVVDVELCD
eukprot:3507170-Ditylum_brightwellii.AAC.1